TVAGHDRATSQMRGPHAGHQGGLCGRGSEVDADDDPVASAVHGHDDPAHRIRIVGAALRPGTAAAPTGTRTVLLLARDGATHGMRGALRRPRPPSTDP